MAIVQIRESKLRELVKSAVVRALTEAKSEDKKWIQGTEMKKGSLHKKLGIPEDQKIPTSLINKKIKEIEGKYKEDEKMSAADLKFVKELNLAKTLKKVNEAFENVVSNFYQGLSPKQAIEKATVDHNFAIKNNNEGQADKISGNLKEYLDSCNYNWKQDPRALDVIGDFVNEEKSPKNQKKFDKVMGEFAKGILKTAADDILPQSKELWVSHNASCEMVR